MQTPHQTVFVQALRNARFAEEIAHGRRKIIFRIKQTGVVPTLADLHHSAELDDMLAVSDRAPVERLCSLQSDNSKIAYCGTGRPVSDGLAVASCIMGVDASFLPAGALATNGSKTEDN
jgi:hypothetical protein